MNTITTISPESDLRANLAADIAEGLATGQADYRVRTPAHDQHYTPLIDVVSLAIGAPQDPILTALLALLAGGLRSADFNVRCLAETAKQAIESAHVESQIEAYVQEDAECTGLFAEAA